MIEVVRAIRPVRIQLLLGSFRMHTFVPLPLQESMAQPSAGKHDQWEGYMTVLVVNYAIITFIRVLTTIIRPMIKFDVEKPQDFFRQEVKWMLAIR
jgi:hypothetical protein